MPGFPENVMDELATSFTQYMPLTQWVDDGQEYEVPILKRPLRYSDPERSIGIHPADWTPDERSSQIGQMEPALARYLIRIQNLVKHTDEDEGRSMYAADAKMVRAILYRDPALHVRLGNLNEDVLDTVERFQRCGVRGQRFLNNELQGQFVFLVTTDFWVETEVTQQ